MKKIWIALVSIVSVFVIFSMTLLYIYYIEEWSIPERTKELNISLSGTKLAEIDEILRDEQSIRNKNAYLNSIVLKSTVIGKDIEYEDLTIEYADKINKSTKNKRYILYSYKINLNKGIVESVTKTGSDQLGGYDKNLVLNESTSIEQYLNNVLNSTVAAPYVSSGKKVFVNLIFKHYDRPYHAIISDGKESVRIDIE